MPFKTGHHDGRGPDLPPAIARVAERRRKTHCRVNPGANFLARFNNHFLSKPDDELFEQIYQENPALYFSSLVQLAKVLKVEVGEVGAFDYKPRPREEALRKLEERAGTDARKLFEAFLKKIDKLQAAALESHEGEE